MTSDPTAAFCPSSDTKPRVRVSIRFVTSRFFAPALLLSLPLLTIGCPSDDDGNGSTSDGTGPTSTDPTTAGPGDATMTTMSTATTTSTTTDPTTGTTTDPTTGLADSTDTSASATDSGSGTDSGSDSGSTGSAGFCEPMLAPPGACDIAEPPPLPLGWAAAGSWSPPSGPDDVLGEPPSAGGFIPMPDGGGGPPIECSIFQQDCPAGEKCMPWANDGGSNWNATRCTPLDPMPDPIGAPCTVEGSGVSGIDSCDVGAMCWNVDDFNNGTCVEMCSCSPVNPICNTPDTACAIANDGVIAVCLSACNPLDPSTCPASEGCYPVGDLFLCAPDASDAGGADGDQCFNINACDPGLACVGAAALPGCFGGVGCCTPMCEVGDDTPCGAGTSCTSWFVAGQAPDPCWDDLGVCVAP